MEKDASFIKEMITPIAYFWGIAGTSITLVMLNYNVNGPTLSSITLKVMKFGFTSMVLIISVSFITILNAQTDAGRDTLNNNPLRQAELALDPLDLEIGEMVFDETITKVGRDFYDEFYSTWSNPTNIKDFSITIKEMPMPGIGTQISVFIDEFELVKQFIRPNLEMIEMLSEYTVSLATQYLLNYQEIQAQLQSADQSGTGIF